MKVLALVFSFLAITLDLLASSVTLINDSAHRLRAVVRGADGTFLGELVIEPHQSQTWQDSYGRSSTVNQPMYSQTPYTVHWYCMGGDEYAVRWGVSTGSQVAAQNCDGKKSCQPPKQEQQKTPAPAPVSPENETLKPENEEYLHTN